MLSSFPETDSVEAETVILGRVPRPRRGFFREHTLFEGWLGRSGAMVTPERGLERSMIYDPLTSRNEPDGGIGVKCVLGA